MEWASEGVQTLQTLIWIWILIHLILGAGQQVLVILGTRQNYFLKGQLILQRLSILGSQSYLRLFCLIVYFLNQRIVVGQRNTGIFSMLFGPSFYSLLHDFTSWSPKLFAQLALVQYLWFDLAKYLFGYV